MDEISKQINEIFIRRTGIDFTKRGDEKDENLFSRNINVDPRELLLIYEDIKEKFKCNLISGVCNRQFDTFNHICDLVKQACIY